MSTDICKNCQQTVVDMAQSKQIVKKLINSIVASENIDDYNVKITALSTEGANYSSVLYKVTISSPKRADLHLFAKVAIVAESLRTESGGNVDKIYENENYFYTKLAPIYELIQEECGIPKQERLKVPKYYGCNSTYMAETMVLEDLGAQGYTLYDRFESLDWDYASKAVEALAKFHALSFAYKHQFPEKYAKDYSRFDSKLLNIFKLLEVSFRKTANYVLDITPEHLKPRLEIFIEENYTDKMLYKFYGPGKRKLVIHGDYRASNILHKNQDGRVVSLIPVDYQTLMLGSPATDLVYLIYSGTDEYFRKKHVEQLLNFYYKTFSEFLLRLNLNPDQVYSRKDLDEDYHEMLPYGLRVAVFLLPIVLVDPQDAPELNDAMDFVAKPNDSFKKRFIPILNEFVNLNII